jgi:hypothetical protein
VKGPDPGARAAAAGELLGTAEARRREKLRREQEVVKGAQEQARSREESGRRSREAAAGEDKRREFRDFVARCKQDGYVVGPLEAKLDSDLDGLRRDLLLFRVQLPRLRELGEELASIDAPALEKRKAELAAMLNDVARIPDLEKGLERLRSESARLNEEDRARREDERRRRAAISEKLFWWSSHGLPVDGLEKLLDGDPAVAEREFSSYEARAQRLLGLKDELAALDTTGFREQAAALEPVLSDVEHVERAESEFAAFRELLARQSTEAIERKALEERLLAWKAKGFLIEPVEPALQGEIGATREGLSRFEERAKAAEAISAQLPQLNLKGFEDRVRQLGEMLPDTSRLEECQGLLAAIRSDQDRARAEALERGEYRRRIEEWKKGGLGTGQLEALMDRDMLAFRKAVVAFQFDVDAYDDMLTQLEPLLRSGHAEEAGRLQKELRDFSRLPELEEKVAALRAGAEAEAVASAKELGREFSTDLALMEKVRGWVASGMTVRRLEGALRHERDPWRAEMERLEREIEDLSKETSALEVLDTKGHESDIQQIRSMLNDPDNLPLVRAYRDALRSRIARRKKEGERKAALAAVAGEWEQKGHRVKQLTEALDRDLEKASQQFVLFRTRISAAEHLRRRLDALGLFGNEAELVKLRRRLDEAENPAEVQSEVDRLWKAAEEKGRERVARRKAARERKRALRERVMGWLEKGMSIRRLERALELSPDESEKELSRFEDDVRRLRELGERIASMSSPAFEPELAVLRSRLDDVDSIPEIEKGLSALAERAERARLEEDARLDAERARLHEQERQAATRRRLEERLKLWSGAGYNVEPLRVALAADTSLAEKRFSEFESAISRSEELRFQLQALQARGLEGVAGAETLEKMLQDPLKLPQAEKAFADFVRRAESAFIARDAEMQRFLERVRELGSKGEDVSVLERAWNKGLAETRQAFAEFDRELVKRERMETWRGIKSRLLSAPSAAAGDAGPETAGAEMGKKENGRPGIGAEGPAENEAAGAQAAKRKIRKLKK